MNKTPIVFSFNDGYLVPAGVAITSLLLNANQGTFYDIFILHSSKRLSEDCKEELLKIRQNFNNCDFTFVDVKDAFEGAFEIRNITIDAYYRLLIPKLIKGYDRVIYSDVDVIFLGDVSESLNMLDANHKIGAVKVLPSYDRKYLSKIGIEIESYCNSGYIVFDLEEIGDYSDELNELIKQKFVYQDQDIMNIIFKGCISDLPYSYCFTYSKLIETPDVLMKIVHYSGVKPWNEIVPCGDIWWEYYRKSIFYNDKKYREFNLKSFEKLAEIKFGYKVSKITGLLNIGKWLRKKIR